MKPLSFLAGVLATVFCTQLLIPGVANLFKESRLRSEAEAARIHNIEQDRVALMRDVQNIGIELRQLRYDFSRVLLLQKRDSFMVTNADFYSQKLLINTNYAVWTNCYAVKSNNIVILESLVWTNGVSKRN